LHLSNTRLFETLGWHGICVEPDAQAFQSLRQNRQCVCLNCACSDHEGTVDFFTQPGRPMGTTNPDAVRKLEAGWKFAPAPAESIPCKTVNRILEEAGFQQLDFVSIDVDGAEVQVLRGFDLGRFSPKLICIETALKQVQAGKWPRDHVDEIDRIIRSYGYHLLKIHGPNSFYSKDRFPQWTRTVLSARRRLAMD
jgi:FkbM family methyltransferase